MIGEHRIRRQLDVGKPVFGLILNFDSPWFVDLLGLAGFDFILIDAEHGPLNAATAQTMIRAAEAAGISALVRVPGNLPHEIQWYLDAGAVGIQVPSVETAEMASAGVAAVRYPPAGERGLATLTRAANYGATFTPAAYMEAANRELAYFATIETRLAVENVDAIAALPGVDGLCIGPGDMSVSMGHKGDRSAPEVIAGIKRVLASAKAHDKWVSLPAADDKTAIECLRMGANIVQFPANYFVLHYGRQFLQAVRNA